MKKILVGLAVFAVAVASKAEYLNWQVDTGKSNTYTGDGFSYTGPVSGANLYATKGGPQEAVLIDSQLLDTQNQKVVDNYADYSFYVELVNYDSSAKTSTAVARSETRSYADLVESSFITPMSQVAQAAVWHASNYSAAPEPTSALLVMMGVAFLGLKRRKA